MSILLILVPRNGDSMKMVSLCATAIIYVKTKTVVGLLKKMNTIVFTSVHIQQLEHCYNQIL